jgi:hypothetical protein
MGANERAGRRYCSGQIEIFDGFWHTCAVKAPGFATGTCSGDSGGPLLTYDADHRIVEVGVIEMGARDCTNTTRPDLFARTNPILGWASPAVASVALPGAPPMAQAPNHPVPPTLNIGTASSYARTMIRQRTRTRPRVSVACLRVNAWKLQCDLSWSTRTSQYTASGTFWHFLQGGVAYWSYDFKGRVSTYRCNTRGCRTVRRRFHWR